MEKNTDKKYIWRYLNWLDLEMIAEVVSIDDDTLKYKIIKHLKVNDIGWVKTLHYEINDISSFGYTYDNNYRFLSEKEALAWMI